MDRPVIIKIGGSLLNHAGPIIQEILKSTRKILIVPGGGIYAETVRTMKVDGTPAHWMAIAGMEQYGWFLSLFGIMTTDLPKFHDEPRIFLPYQYLKKCDPLPHSWDVTSDTISAWLASTLSADLLVLKSLDQIRADGILIDQIRSQISTQDVDNAFIPFILSHQLKGIIINGAVPERILDALEGKSVIGTQFGITI